MGSGAGKLSEMVKGLLFLGTTVKHAAEQWQILRGSLTLMKYLYSGINSHVGKNTTAYPNPYRPSGNIQLIFCALK